MTKNASRGADSWSVRANYWRGDRALGGRLEVAHGRITFTPHGIERSLGGRDVLDVNVLDVRSLMKAPRSLKVPRARLILRTDDADHYFLVPRLDEVIGRLQSATGLSARRDDLDGTTRPLDSPEHQPDDSPAMNLIYSGWLHLSTLMILSIFFAAAWGVNGASSVWLVVLGALISFEVWMTIRSFRRTARVKAQRRATTGGR